VKIPKIGAIHKKTLARNSPSHGTLTKKEERHRNENLSPTPKKSNQSGEGKQTLTAVDMKENREPTGPCVLEFSTRESGTEIGLENQNKRTKIPTPSIVDENRR
jgi:hypothetical protein